MHLEQYEKSGLPVILVILVTGIIYFPALDSIFLLDDIPNLRDLTLIPDRGYFYYLLGSNAGPTGRPLSLLTFAFQHSDWPDNPFAFKLINLLIHLVNGGLVFVLTKMLTEKTDFTARERLFTSLMVSFIWMLHPMHVNTVLYSIQRMTLLSSMLMLAGIILALGCTVSTRSARDKVNTIRFAAIVYGIMCLSILAKEIGLLMPVYILTVLVTIACPVMQEKQNRRSVLAVLLLPVLVSIVYLFFFRNILNVYSIRSFTLWERLLTECNVLIDYLKLVIIPSSKEFTLFHDDYTVARSLFHPVYTLFNLSIITGLISGAVLLRKKYPVFSFSILWFFSGHLLESTVVGLELYYEHRNYLPSLGIIFFIGYALVRLSRSVRKPYILLISSVWCLSIGVTTAGELELWKNPYLQARTWYLNHPDSRRALDHYWNMSLIYSRHEDMATLYNLFRKKYPNDIYPLIKKVVFKACYDVDSYELDENFWRDAHELSGNTKQMDLSFISLYEDMMDRISRGRCRTDDLDRLIRINDGLLSNRHLAHLQRRLLDINTTFSYFLGDYDQALVYLEKNRNYRSEVDLLVTRSQILIAQGKKEKAKQVLEKTRQILKNKYSRRLYYHNKLEQLEQEAGI